MEAGEEGPLVLYEEPKARRAGRPAGLFHYALLFPSREELARAALRLARQRPRSKAPLTTAPTRRSTCATPTATASSWPGTATRASGRRGTAGSPSRGAPSTSTA